MDVRDILPEEMLGLVPDDFDMGLESRAISYFMDVRDILPEEMLGLRLVCPVTTSTWASTCSART